MRCMARIEDGKHSRLANRVLHSMDLAIEYFSQLALGLLVQRLCQERKCP